MGGKSKIAKGKRQYNSLTNIAFCPLQYCPFPYPTEEFRYFILTPTMSSARKKTASGSA